MKKGLREPYDLSDDIERDECEKQAMLYSAHLTHDRESLLELFNELLHHPRGMLSDTLRIKCMVVSAQLIKFHNE